MNIKWKKVEQAPTDGESVRAQRQAAYRAESDPLFFEAELNGSSKDTWRAKVAEIKARFPMP